MEVAVRAKAICSQHYQALICARLFGGLSVLMCFKTLLLPLLSPPARCEGCTNVYGISTGILYLLYLQVNISVLLVGENSFPVTASVTISQRAAPGSSADAPPDMVMDEALFWEAGEYGTVKKLSVDLPKMVRAFGRRHAGRAICILWFPGKQSARMCALSADNCFAMWCPCRACITSCEHLA